MDSSDTEEVTLEAIEDSTSSDSDDGDEDEERESIGRDARDDVSDVAVVASVGNVEEVEIKTPRQEFKPDLHTTDPALRLGSIAGTYGFAAASATTRSNPDLTTFLARPSSPPPRTSSSTSVPLTGSTIMSPKGGNRSVASSNSNGALSVQGQEVPGGDQSPLAFTERRQICQYGSDCTILDAEHFVLYTHTPQRVATPKSTPPTTTPTPTPPTSPAPSSSTSSTLGLSSPSLSSSTRTTGGSGRTLRPSSQASTTSASPSASSRSKLVASATKTTPAFDSSNLWNFFTKRRRVRSLNVPAGKEEADDGDGENQEESEDAVKPDEADGIDGRAKNEKYASEPTIADSDLKSAARVTPVASRKLEAERMGGGGRGENGEEKDKPKVQSPALMSFLTFEKLGSRSRGNSGASTPRDLEEVDLMKGEDGRDEDEEEEEEEDKEEGVARLGRSSDGRTKAASLNVMTEGRSGDDGRNSNNEATDIGKEPSSGIAIAGSSQSPASPLSSSLSSLSFSAGSSAPPSTSTSVASSPNSSPTSSLFRWQRLRSATKQQPGASSTRSLTSTSTKVGGTEGVKLKSVWGRGGGEISPRRRDEERLDLAAKLPKPTSLAKHRREEMLAATDDKREQIKALSGIEPSAEVEAKINRLKLEIKELSSEILKLWLEGDSFVVWQNQRKRLIEISIKSQLTICDVVHVTTNPDAWVVLPQQLSGPGSLLMRPPEYNYCKLSIIAPDGRAIKAPEVCYTSIPNEGEKRRSVKQNHQMDLMFEIRMAQRVHYIDELLSVTKDSKVIRPRDVDPSPDGGGILLEWNNGTKDLFYVEDAKGLQLVITCHAEFFKRRKTREVGRLRELYRFTSVPYDASNPEHEQMLRSLWTVVFPEVPLESLVSQKWKGFGFQGNDPTTDFRGMGLLGLKNLLYYAHKYTPHLRSLLESFRSYPVASTGINISQMLLKLLHLDDSLVNEHETSSKWDTPLLTFLCACSDAESNGFEEFYCFCFHLFDQLWVQRGAGYMDFPEMMQQMYTWIEKAIALRPNSFGELRSRMQQQQRDSK